MNTQTNQIAWPTEPDAFERCYSALFYFQRVLLGARGKQRQERLIDFLGSDGLLCAAEAALAEHYVERIMRASDEDDSDQLDVRHFLVDQRVDPTLFDQDEEDVDDCGYPLVSGGGE